MTTLTFTGSALPVIALGVAWFVTRLLAPHTGAHQLRRAAATPVGSAPETGPSPLRGGEGPPTLADNEVPIVRTRPWGTVPIAHVEPPTLADADWGDLHAMLRDGGAVTPLPRTRVAPDIAAHFARREAGQL